jgi:cation diffusion facilitator family transporter
VHVLADAFTSVLAITALAGGVWFGLNWLDPAVALLGAAVIGQWSLGVLKSTARALVDATEDPALAQRVRDLIEADGDAKVADLHVWQVGSRAWCAALAVVADAPLPAVAYRERLAAVDQLRHVTVEVHRCPGASPG